MGAIVTSRVDVDDVTEEEKAGDEKRDGSKCEGFLKKKYLPERERETE